MKTISLRKIAIFLTIPALALLASCKEDNDEPTPGNEDNTSNVETAAGQLPPDEAYEYLRGTFSDFYDMMNPEPLYDVMKLAKDFLDEFGEFGTPEMGEDNNPANYMRRLKSAANPNGMGLIGLTRAAYDWSINEYTGIYTPDYENEEWVKTGESNCIIFRCKVKNKDLELKVAPENGEWVVDYVTDGESYAIPSVVITTLTYGNTLMAKATVDSKFDKKAHTGHLVASASIANIECSTNLQANDSKITESGEVKIGGKALISGNTAVTGSNLADYDFYKDLDESADDPDYDNIFKNVTSSVTLIGRVTIDGRANNYSKFTEAADWYKDHNDGNRMQLTRECQAQCDIINRYFNCAVRFAGCEAQQASFIAVPYVEFWNEGDESQFDVYPTAAVKYAADDSIEILQDINFDFNPFKLQLNSIQEKFESMMRSIYN